MDNETLRKGAIPEAYFLACRCPCAPSLAVTLGVQHGRHLCHRAYGKHRIWWRASPSPRSVFTGDDPLGDHSSARRRSSRHLALVRSNTGSATAKRLSAVLLLCRHRHRPADAGAAVQSGFRDPMLALLGALTTLWQYASDVLHTASSSARAFIIGSSDTVQPPVLRTEGHAAVQAMIGYGWPARRTNIVAQSPVAPTISAGVLRVRAGVPIRESPTSCTDAYFVLVSRCGLRSMQTCPVIDSRTGIDRAATGVVRFTAREVGASSAIGIPYRRSRTSRQSVGNCHLINRFPAHPTVPTRFSRDGHLRLKVIMNAVAGFRGISRYGAQPADRLQTNGAPSAICLDLRGNFCVLPTCFHCPCPPGG